MCVVSIFTLLIARLIYFAFQRQTGSDGQGRAESLSPLSSANICVPSVILSKRFTLGTKEAITTSRPSVRFDTVSPWRWHLGDPMLCIRYNYAPLPRAGITSHLSPIFTALLCAHTIYLALLTALIQSNASSEPDFECDAGHHGFQWYPLGPDTGRQPATFTSSIAV